MLWCACMFACLFVCLIGCLIACVCVDVLFCLFACLIVVFFVRLFLPFLFLSMRVEGCRLPTNRIRVARTLYMLDARARHRRMWRASEEDVSSNPQLRCAAVCCLNPSCMLVRIKPEYAINVLHLKMLEPAFSCWFTCNIIGCFLVHRFFPSFRRILVFVQSG